MIHKKRFSTLKALLFTGTAAITLSVFSIPASANSNDMILQAMSTGTITQTNTSIIYDIAPIQAIIIIVLKIHIVN